MCGPRGANGGLLDRARRPERQRCQVGFHGLGVVGDTSADGRIEIENNIGAPTHRSFVPSARTTQMQQLATLERIELYDFIEASLEPEAHPIAVGIDEGIAGLSRNATSGRRRRPSGRQAQRCRSQLDSSGPDASARLSR